MYRYTHTHTHILYEQTAAEGEGDKVRMRGKPASMLGNMSLSAMRQSQQVSLSLAHIDTYMHTNIRILC